MGTEMDMQEEDHKEIGGGDQKVMHKSKKQASEEMNSADLL